MRKLPASGMSLGTAPTRDQCHTTPETLSPKLHSRRKGPMKKTIDVGSSELQRLLFTNNPSSGLGFPLEGCVQQGFGCLFGGLEMDMHVWTTFISKPLLLPRPSYVVPSWVVYYNPLPKIHDRPKKELHRSPWV